MSFFKKMKEKIILNKKTEQIFYELALIEFSTGNKRLGLWAMALSKSDGSIEHADALYIGLLAEEIKNDEYLESNKIEEMEKQQYLLQLQKEKEMKKLIDPRFKNPQPYVKRH